MSAPGDSGRREGWEDAWVDWVVKGSLQFSSHAMVPLTASLETPNLIETLDSLPLGQALSAVPHSLWSQFHL